MGHSCKSSCRGSCRSPRFLLSSVLNFLNRFPFLHPFLFHCQSCPSVSCSIFISVGNSFPPLPSIDPHAALVCGNSSRVCSHLFLDRPVLSANTKTSSRSSVTHVPAFLVNHYSSLFSYIPCLLFPAFCSLPTAPRLVGRRHLQV